MPNDELGSASSGRLGNTHPAAFQLALLARSGSHVGRVGF